MYKTMTACAALATVLIAPVASAQPAQDAAVAATHGLKPNYPAPQPMPTTGTVLVTLGTAGGPLPQANRTQLSDALIVNGTPYVIDAGDNVTRRLVQAGIDFRKVGHVFITHPHSDHTLGLPTLLVSEWEFQRRTPIEVLGPPGTAELVKGVEDFAEGNAEIRWAEGKKVPMPKVFEGKNVKTGVVYQDQNVKVTAAENTHFHFAPGTPPYGKYKSYSYRFDTAGKSIVFTGDTGPSPAVETLAHGADVLVSEIISIDDTIGFFKKVGIWQAKTPGEQQGMIKHFEEEHLTAQEVGKLATRAGVKTVILTHFTPTANPADDFARYADAVRQYFKGEVLVSNDLDRFQF